MTYEEKRKLIEAANLLKENCRKKYKDGCDCVFANGDVCILADFFPSEWKMTKVKRWTPEDITLAKALKEVGVTEICATSSGQRAWISDDVGHGYLPDSVFKNVFCGEVFRLDDIIKESEE